MRRNPIFDEVTADLKAGKHRVETVVNRLVDGAIDHLEQLRTTENLMDLTSVLGRLDAVVAAAGSVRASVEADVAAQVDSRVTALEAALGVSAPADTTPAPDAA